MTVMNVELMLLLSKQLVGTDIFTIEAVSAWCGHFSIVEAVSA